MGYEISPDYKSEIEAITSSSLTPETLSTFAETALNGLIGVVEAISANYKRQPTIAQPTKRDIETAAFSYFGVGEIETILDHVSQKAQEIDQLDDVIAEIPITPAIFVPPSEVSPRINPGNGTFEQKTTIERLKTVLFILGNEFDIDVYDPEAVAKHQGIVSDSMMRQSSYYSLDIAKLDKTILVCDEQNNATFVFTSSILKSAGIDGTALTALHKPELDALVEQSPGNATKIIYSKQFVIDMVAALSGDMREPKAHSTKIETPKYLVPRAPQDYRSAAGIASELGLTGYAISSIMGAVADQLGPTATYRFQAIVSKAYSPDQQALITEYAERSGLLDQIRLREAGHLSVHTYAKKLGVGYNTVAESVASIEAELGKVELARTQKTEIKMYSPDQLELIRQDLERRGVLIDKAPEGYLSGSKLAQDLGIHYPAVKAIIAELGESLGEVLAYRFEKIKAPGFSPEQQALIRDRFNQRTPEAPEDVSSLTGLAKKIGLATETIELAIDELGSRLGPAEVYRFNAVITSGYKPEQQLAIENQLIESGRLHKTMPENRRAAIDYINQYGMSYTTLAKVLVSAQDQLGPTELFRYGNRVTPGYTEAQQAIIEARIHEQGLTSGHAPEGYLSTRALGERLDVSKQVIAKAAKDLGETLGRVDRYLFTNKRVPGFSPDQQEQIREYLDGKNILGARPPEGYVSINQIVKAHGVARTTLYRTINKLSEQLQPEEYFKFGGTLTRGLSESDTRLILTHIRSEP